RIAATGEVASFNERFSAAHRRGGGTDPEKLASVWVGLSVTAAGLQKLAVGDPFGAVAADAFGAFRRGAHGSADRLGDVEADAAGAFVLGHEDSPGNVAAMPGWMRDGSFQVSRRLGQNVPGWWAQVQDAAGVVGTGMSPDAFAAKLVGRWRSGTPLALSPDSD